MNKIRKWIRYWAKSREAWQIICQLWGWERSFHEKRPVDGNGVPIPWYTYPAIEFLRSLDLRDRRIFEYGCGNSSLFLAGLAREVVSVENDPLWAQEVRQKRTPNLTIITAVDKGAYVSAPLTAGGVFDIVVVDGRHRKECALLACDVVSPQGMIIFDNADWYPSACDALRSSGWFQVDFSGLGPINPYAWTTSVFLHATVNFQRAKGVLPVGGNPAGAN